MKSTIKESQNSIEMEVPLVTYKRGDIFICYCPVLELMTYSEDESKLEKYFDEVLDHFLTTQKENNSLRQTLLNLGWSIEKKEFKKPAKILVSMGMLHHKNISMPSAAMAC